MLFVEEVSPLIHEASSVLTNWRDRYSLDRRDNAFYLKAPFKALKDTAHKNNCTTKSGDNLVQMRINK